MAGKGALVLGLVRPRGDIAFSLCLSVLARLGRRARSRYAWRCVTSTATAPLGVCPRRHQPRGTDRRRDPSSPPPAYANVLDYAGPNLAAEPVGRVHAANGPVFSARKSAPPSPEQLQRMAKPPSHRLFARC